MRTSRILRRAILPALLGGLFCATPALAAEPGFYIGGKLGAASVDGDFIDDDDTSWGAYAGFQFNDWLAIEGVYTDFGDVEVDLDDFEVETSDLEPDSIGLRAMGAFPVSERFDILAGIGWHTFDLNPAAGEELHDLLGDDSSTDLFYGIGAQFNFANNLSIRAMYDRFEFDGPDADEISLGVQYTF